MRRYVVALSTMALTSVVIIAWSHFSRYQHFFEYHTVIAEHSTRSVARNIDEMIEQKERYTRILIEQQNRLVGALINNPNSDEIHEQLAKSVAEFFPDYFTFTIADDNGNPLLEDIESLVGPVCIQDLHQYMQSGVQKPRVHPSPHAYHFDIATPFTLHNKRYIFFISYRTELLGKIIQASQAHDHHLYLAMKNPNGRYLLEATSKGGRDRENRDSYLLSREELSRNLSQEVIPHTRWTVFDSYTPTLYSGFMSGLIMDSLIYLGTFTLVISILGIYLYRAEQRKRLAEKHKDEFLSIISHELRTPLTAITGALGLLQNLKESDADKKDSLFKIAINNASKLTSLVNDILDLQKMETGKMDYKMDAMSVHEMLADAINDMQGYASDAGAEIESRFFEHDDIAVLGDKTRLMQVMFNLISNAIKYGAKHDRIIIDTEITKENMIRISITDHGDGVPDDFRQRIFDKFSQADSSNTRKLPGSGLGLSIVKSIITEHNGNIGFSSEPKKGSCFYFELPVMGGGKSTN